MTREQHLQWAKGRALEYAHKGEMQEAFTSFLSDLNKHPELKDALKIHAELGSGLFFEGYLNDPVKMAEWIGGFN